MIYFFITVVAVVFGFTWNRYLTARMEILDFVSTIISRYIKNKKIRKLMYACAKCVAGQFALWIGVIYPVLYGCYSVEGHFVSILFAIFGAGILDTYVKEK